MAEANSLVDKLNRDFLECGICLDRFKDPRCLPCLHSFCSECLQVWCKEKKEIACPNCNRPTVVPEDGASGFPVQFMVTSLQETVDLEKLKVQEEITTITTPCSNCNLSGQIATVHCLDCKESFCETCRESHDALKPMKHHTVINIEDVLSGKVSLAPAVTGQDQVCEEHDGDTKRFYCQTCEKSVCRDCVVLSHREHQYVSLKEVSKERATRLVELTEQCEGLKKACQDAVEKTETIEGNLTRNIAVAKKKLATLISGYKQQLDDMQAKHESQLHSLEVERGKQLCHVKDGLQAKLDAVTDACDLSSKVTQTGSDYEVTSMYPTLSATIEALIKTSTPIAADDILGYAAIEVIKKLDILGVVNVLNGETWKQTDQFSTISVKSANPCGIVVHPSGDVALTKAGFSRQFAQVFTDAGCLVHTFKGSFDAQLYDIAITHDNRYVLPGKAEILHYDSEGNHLKSTTNATTYDVNNKPSTPLSLDVDTRGRIVAGLHGNTISIHHGDGSFISKFATHATPRCLATTCNDEIAISFVDKTLRIMDYSGNNVRVLQCPQELPKWNPGYICCSERGEIFVVNRGDPTSVYRYTADRGQCLGCVVTGLEPSWGIALSKDEQQLYVTEWSKHGVKIFNRQ